jgi:uncharacterized protein
LKRFLGIIIALLVSAPALAFEIPDLKGQVNDYAKLLTAEQSSALNDRLKGIESGSGDTAQVVVLTLPSLDGESIDKIRNDVFHAWKLGQAGKDNGVLIVIAPVERKIGIEVGYGLEPYLPDGVTKRITEEKMKPFLKKGAENWFKALDAGAEAIGTVVVAREKIAPETEKPVRKIFWVVPFFGAALVGVVWILWATGRRREREAEEALERAATWTSSRYRPDPPRPSTTGRTASAAALGAGLGAGLASKPKAKPAASRSDDSSSRSSSSGSDSSSSWSGSSSSSSSDSGNSYGGGGDSGGGGSSSDF